MRVGIIGGGNISDTHARAAQAIEGLTVDAVFGANAARSAALAAKVGATSYDDFGRFLAHGLDLVIIGSPSGCHAEQAIAAARKGLHVLVEKPIDVTTARVDAMLEEVDRAGVKLGVCFQDRLHPDINATKAFVDAGSLGKPVLASGHVKWYRPPEYYSGSRWRGNRGTRWRRRRDEPGDPHRRSAAVDVRTCRPGLRAERPHVCMRSRSRTRRSRCWSSRAARRLASKRRPRCIPDTRARRADRHGRDDRDRARSRRPIRPAVGRAGCGVDVGGRRQRQRLVSRPCRTRAAHQRIIRDFVKAIETGGTPICDGREGRRSVALVEAIYKSAKTAAAG